MVSFFWPLATVQMISQFFPQRGDEQSLESEKIRKWIRFTYFMILNLMEISLLKILFLHDVEYS